MKGRASPRQVISFRSQSTIWLTSHWPSIPVTPLPMTTALFIVISRFSWFLEEPLSFALHCTKSLFGALMCTAPLENRPIQNLKVESAAMIRSMIHPGPGTRTGQFRDFKKREKWSGFKMRSPSAAIARTSCFEPPSPTQGQELLNSHSTVNYRSSRKVPSVKVTHQVADHDKRDGHPKNQKWRT